MKIKCKIYLCNLFIWISPGTAGSACGLQKFPKNKDCDVWDWNWFKRRFSCHTRHGWVWRPIFWDRWWWPTGGGPSSVVKLEATASAYYHHRIILNWELAKLLIHNIYWGVVQFWNSWLLHTKKLILFLISIQIMRNLWPWVINFYGNNIRV